MLLTHRVNAMSHWRHRKHRTWKMPANSSPDHEIHRRHVLIYEAVGIQI